MPDVEYKNGTEARIPPARPGRTGRCDTRTRSATSPLDTAPCSSNECTPPTALSTPSPSSGPAAPACCRTSRSCRGWLSGRSPCPPPPHPPRPPSHGEDSRTGSRDKKREPSEVATPPLSSQDTNDLRGVLPPLRLGQSLELCSLSSETGMQRHSHVVSQWPRQGKHASGCAESSVCPGSMQTVSKVVRESSAVAFSDAAGARPTNASNVLVRTHRKPVPKRGRIPN